MHAIPTQESVGLGNTSEGPFRTCRRRLAIGILLPVLMLLCISSCSIYSVRKIDRSLTENAEFNSLVLRAATNFRISARERSIAIRDIVLAPSAEVSAREEQEISQLAGLYAESDAILQRTLKSTPSAAPEIAGLLQSVSVSARRTEAVTSRIVELVRDNNRREAIQLLWSEAKPQYDQWLVAIDRLIDYMESRADRNTQDARRTASDFPALMLGLCLLAVGACLVGSMLLSRGILNDLAAAHHQLRSQLRSSQQEKAATPDRPHNAGNDATAGINAPPATDSSNIPAADKTSIPLTATPQVLVPASRAALKPEPQRVHVADSPAVAEAGKQGLLATLHDMRSGLAILVSAARDFIHQQQSVSNIADDGLEPKSRGLQASRSLENIASNIEALTCAMHETTDVAYRATEFATAAAAAAGHGSDVMQEVMEIMDSMQASNQKFSDVSSVIDAIAFESGVLAVNAAVEAARVGEHGSAFVVVATGVRDLAQRSAESAQEIKKLFSSSEQQIAAGNHLVRDAEETMQTTLQSVQRISAILGNISASADIRPKGDECINHAMRALNHLNAALQNLDQDQQRLAGIGSKTES